MAIFGDGHRDSARWIKHTTRCSDKQHKHRPTGIDRNHRSGYKWFRPFQHRKLHSNHARSSVPNDFLIPRTWNQQPNNNSENNKYNKRNRYHKYLLPVVAILTCSPAMATDVGGVSATANPIANSSGSVTNQAIQVLQGPYINNQYGGGISCQGPTLNITPFITGSLSEQHPFELMYNDPVYNNADNNDDGIPDNPGEILYYIPTRTGQKNNTNVSLGLSATISVPLDKQLQKGCKNAFNTQIALQQQILANKRLDFEIARLKNCGELFKAGISFKEGTQYASVCADVQVANVTSNSQHTHSINNTSFINSDPEETTTYEVDANGNKTVKSKTISIKTNAREISTFEYDENGNSKLIKRETTGENENYIFEPISIGNTNP